MAEAALDASYCCGIYLQQSEFYLKTDQVPKIPVLEHGRGGNMTTSNPGIIMNAPMTQVNCGEGSKGRELRH